mgnify:CR=1 FL=1
MNACSSANVQAGNNENNDSDVQSEFEEIITDIDPVYDENFQPLTKWTKDHPLSQVIGDQYFFRGSHTCSTKIEEYYIIF